MRLAALLTLACTGLAAAGCSSASGSVASGARPHDGTAIVATSGSLQYLNDTTLGRAFTKATGYGYRARSADTLAATGFTGRSRPNVVESVGTQPFQVDGHRLSSWYVRYAATSMVIAYNPKTKYGLQLAAIAHHPDLEHDPKVLASLFPLLAQPGLRLGRPAPGFDPQGTAFIEMLELAQRQYGFPASLIPKILRGPVTATTGPQIFNPYTLVHRLQAGQLDAIAAYRSEVVQLHLRYIPLPVNHQPRLRHPFTQAALRLSVGAAGRRHRGARRAAGDQHQHGRQAERSRAGVRRVRAVGRRSGAALPGRLPHHLDHGVRRPQRHPGGHP